MTSRQQDLIDGRGAERLVSKSKNNFRDFGGGYFHDQYQCSPDYISRKKEPKRRGRPKKPRVIHEGK